MRNVWPQMQRLVFRISKSSVLMLASRLRQGETIEVFGIKLLQHGFLLTRDE
jgi:hypothetical protein